jgi:hypothetical protein
MKRIQRRKRKYVLGPLHPEFQRDLSQMGLRV